MARIERPASVDELNAARNAALEEAAKVCRTLEGRVDYTDMDEFRMIDLCQKAIRALKRSKPQAGRDD